MPTLHHQTSTAAQIECGCCLQKLPLRLTANNEQATVWLCANCNVPFVACCVKEELFQHGQRVRLDERFFDIRDQPLISVATRRQALQLASRVTGSKHLEMRRSQRNAVSLAAPAIALSPSLTPTGNPFQIMVANLSREGIGLIHDEQIDTKYLALELAPRSDSPIQVIVEVVRQRELVPPFFEYGGVFRARLGSLAAE
jgi:hypothetical protein